MHEKTRNAIKGRENKKGKREYCSDEAASDQDKASNDSERLKIFAHERHTRRVIKEGYRRVNMLQR